MKQVLFSAFFLLFVFVAIAQNVKYNNLSGEYQYDPPRGQVQQPAATSYWQWEDRNAGHSLTPSSDAFQYQAQYQSRQQITPLQVDTSFSLPANQVAIETPLFTNYSPVPAANFSNAATVQNITPQFTSPVVQWRFARPQEELISDLPAFNTKVDEAQVNTPGVIARTTPRPEIIARESDRAPIVAEDERNRLNWQTVE